MTNPLLAPFDAPHGLPPFDRIAPEHFRDAAERAMTEHADEIAAIRDNPEDADFSNTIRVLEGSGRLLDRVMSAFYTLAAGDANAEIQAIERALAPLLARHRTAILMDQGLWARVKAVVAKMDGMPAEDARVTELARRRFVRAGADLDEAGRARMGELQERLASLGTAFSQNVIADERDWALELAPDDTEGLPEALLAAAEAEGRARGRERPVITLARSSVEPFLASTPRRELRETAWLAWTARGETTNWPIIAETLALRGEQARLLGFASYADYRLADQMAKTPAAVRDLLMRIWEPARARALEEEASLAALAHADGIERLEPWDWRYYAERLRRERHALSDAEIKPYLPLDRVIAAAFDVARRLFGLTFREVEGLPLPHPDARAWEVRRNGTVLGLFIGDYFARPSKRSGAWASGLNPQQRLWSPERPVIQNTLNLAKGEPTLLSFDDARTLFHEFGHALHGLLSDVTYPSISGTRVARDFVELPSQLYEHWLSVPDVLAEHARHHSTGEPMPAEIIERLRAAETFNQGFQTVEYLASAIVDMEMHAPEAEGRDPKAIEAETLARIGMPHAIAMRHRSPHFLHVFAGAGYAAGYYSYIWSEVMDADAFAAFEEAGDPFDPALAARLAETVLSAGGRAEPEECYVAFRGRMPGIEPLLAGRGLAPAA